MTELIACLSTGKGTWAEVTKLIKSQDWDKVILITNDFGAKTFKKDEKTKLIIINSDESIELIIDKISNGLKETVTGMEVALNLVSGSGKEHMAILSSVLKLGVGIRLITHTVNGLKEI